MVNQNILANGQDDSLDSFPGPAPGQPLHQEWETFKREVRRLIAEGQQGHFVLIKGDRVIGVWDTWREAAQAGDQHCGLEGFLVQEVQLFVRSVRSGYYRLCQT